MHVKGLTTKCRDTTLFWFYRLHLILSTDNPSWGKANKLISLMIPNMVILWQKDVVAIGGHSQYGNSLKLQTHSLLEQR